MGSPMPKISWGCKKQMVIAETGCDSDETYFEGSSPRNTIVKDIIPNAAKTILSDLYHEHSQSLKVNSATNANYTSLIGTHIQSNINLSNSQSTRQQKLSTESACVRRLSWKEPIASYSQGPSKQSPKKSSQGDPKREVPKLNTLHEKVSRMNSKLTRSLLAGGRPLTYEKAERMLRKAEQCIEQLTKLSHSPQPQVRETRLVANLIVKRLSRKMTEIKKEGSKLQRPTNNSHSIPPLKNQTPPLTADIFETQLSSSQTTLENGQELIWKDDSLKQSRSQTQMTATGLTCLNTYFENPDQTTDERQMHSRDNLKTQPENSPSLLLPMEPIGNLAQQMKITQANSSKLRFLAQVDSVATERYAQSLNGFETQSTMSLSLSMTDGQMKQQSHMETNSAVQMDSQSQGETNAFQASSDMFSSYDFQPKEGARDDQALPSKGAEKTQGCDGTKILSCVTGEMISVSGDDNEFRDGFEMDRGSFQESLQVGLEVEARSSNAEDSWGMRSSGKTVGNVGGNGDSQATLCEDSSQDFIEDTLPMDFKSVRSSKIKENQLVEEKTADRSLPEAVEKTTSLPMGGMGRKSLRKMRKPKTSEDKIERLISDVIKNMNHLPSKSPISETFSRRGTIPIEMKSNEAVEILWESAEKQSQPGKNTSKGISNLEQDSSLAENELPHSSFSSDLVHRKHEANVSPNGESGKRVCDDNSSERFPESCASRNFRSTEFSTPSQRRNREVIVLSTAEKLDDKQWRLLQALYERQKSLRESQKTGEMSAEQTNFDDCHQLLGQMMEHDGNKVSTSRNCNELSGSNFQTKTGNYSSLSTPESLPGSQGLSATQLTTTDLTENDGSTQTTTQTSLEFSQDIGNNCIRSGGRKLSAVNANGGRSVTQAMLEDSQEMDFGAGEQSPTNLIGNRTQPSSQEVVAHSHDNGTQSAACCLEPSATTDGERNFGSNEISTQDLLEDSQEMPSQGKKEIIAPSKMSGANFKFTSRLVKSSLKADGETQNPRFGKVLFSCFVAPKSAVLGVPSLKTFSPAPTESRRAIPKNQTSDKNNLPRQNPRKASKDMTQKSQANSQNGSSSMETNSILAFEATAKSQPQMFGKISVLRPFPPTSDAKINSLSPNIRAGSQEKQNSTPQLEFDFLRPQNPVKKGKKWPLPKECVSTQKSTASMATSNSTSCFQRIPADKSESLTQLLVQDSQEWSARDLECIGKPTSSISQTATSAHDSGVNLIGLASQSTVKTANKAVENQSLAKQLSIQNVPGLTAIDVTITRVFPLKTAQSLEATNKKEKLDSMEGEVAGLPNLTTSSKQYGYFVGTPMTENSRQNLVQQGSVGKVSGIVSHQNQSAKSSIAFPYSVQQQGRSNQPTYQQILVGNQAGNQRPVSVPLNQSQTTKQTVKTAQSTGGHVKNTLPNRAQGTMTAKDVDQYDSVNTLILNMFGFKNVMRQREAEGQGVVTVQNVSEAARAAGKVPNPLMSRFKSSVLSDLLSPKELDPARQAERDMILSLTHVRRRSASDFAPTTREIAEFMQKPFTWDNVPADILKDLEDSSDED